MNYTESILWLATWPIVIIVAYVAVVFVVKRKKLFKDEEQQ